MLDTGSASLVLFSEPSALPVAADDSGAFVEDDAGRRRFVPQSQRYFKVGSKYR